jgi:tRNA U34 5-methylaminomethyl-2-thiouridine-forming methyltransferase MnmC
MEYYEKRFGLIAIEKGYLTPEQLIEALKVQVFEDINKKAHRLIGEILLDMDIMTANQIEETVKVSLKSRVGR